jgi:N-acetylglucosaminyldiphosphoundecaprenol N-acetyl-beta-D-mannosaminyltransferase
MDISHYLNWEPNVTSVIGINVSETSYADAKKQIQDWAQAGESRAVYATNVHSTMEAHDVLEFREILNRADLVTPDGMPLVWVMRLKGVKNQQRTYGPTLMLHVLEMAACEKIPVGFYGADPQTLDMLVARMKTVYPALQVNYAFSPPFRLLTEGEMRQIRQEFIRSGVRILFVGLGCPRQEKWIDIQRGHVPAVMIGVGAAFDFHAGIKSQAPAWMQKIGLEWLFRLLTEPRRLWKRYLYHNPRFIFLAVADILGLLKKAG